MLFYEHTYCDSRKYAIFGNIWKMYLYTYVYINIFIRIFSTTNSKNFRAKRDLRRFSTAAVKWTKLKKSLPEYIIRTMTYSQ